MNYTITISEANQRVDRFCRKYFKHTPEVKLGDIFSWIRKWAIRVNGKKVKEKTRLEIGDHITWNKETVTDKSALDVTRSKAEKVASYSIDAMRPLIIHEDNHRLVRNKPTGTLTHPWQKNTTNITMHEMLQSYLQQTGFKTESETFKPSFCYRLDKDTSWVLISAKSYEGLQLLNKKIREREVSKQYQAIVVWHPTPQVIESSLFTGFDRKSGRSKVFVNEELGKASRSEILKVKKMGSKELWPYSLISVKITTWRMHQIRVHCASIWHPVIWDLTYGIAPLNRLAKKHFGIIRQLLHSYEYSFEDTIQNRIWKFQAKLPDEFKTMSLS